MSSPEITSATILSALSGNDSVAKRQNGSEAGKVSPPEEKTVSPEPANREAVEQAVVQIADFVQNISRELQFQVDDSTGYTQITVRDRETEEVIRQIPSDEVLAIARYIADNGAYPVKGSLMNSEG